MRLLAAARRFRPGRCLLVFVAVALAGNTGALPASAAAQERLSIPLRLQEPAGIARNSEPVTAGVPLPRSAALRDVGALGLLDERGRDVAVQARVLSRWDAPVGDERAPIRWLQLHFQADVPAHGVRAFQVVRLDADGAYRPRAQVGIASAERGGVVVRTGPLSFYVDDGPFRLLDAVQLDLDGDGRPDVEPLQRGHTGGVQIGRVDGTIYESRLDTASRTQVRVEENGPLHSVVRVDGIFHSATNARARRDDGSAALEHLEYTARIHAYAGKSWVRVFLAVRNPDRFLTTRHNNGGEPLEHQFESFELRLPLSSGDSRGTALASIGGEAVTEREFPAKQRVQPLISEASLEHGEELSVYQDSSGGPNWQDSDDGSWGTRFAGYRIRHTTDAANQGSRGVAGAAREVSTGAQASGWANLEFGSWGAAIAMRHFWQNSPKGLRVGGDGTLILELWPAAWSDTHRLAGGRQKTHEILLDFHGDIPPGPGNPDRSAVAVARRGPADLSASFAEPLYATVPPTWTRESLALGPISVRSSPHGSLGNDPLLTRLEATADAAAGLASGADGVYSERSKTDAYGWRNWGDSYRDGSKSRRSFGNNEFDFAYGLLLEYVRSERPERRFFDLAESMVRHLSDIDIYHTDEDSSAYSRGIRQHDYSGARNHSAAPLLSHAWIRGLLTYYLLTGDRQALEAAQEVGGWIEGMIDDSGELDFNKQSRSQAWAALALTELWEVTGIERYRERARSLLRAEIVDEQSLRGALYPCAALDWEGEPGDVAKHEVAIWHNGYVAEALGRYAFDVRMAGRPDGEIEHALFRLLDAISRCGFATDANGLFVDGDSKRDNSIGSRRYAALVIDRLYDDGTYRMELPNNHLLTNGYAYGALLSESRERQGEYLRMAYETWRWTMGPTSAPGVPRDPPRYCCPATPAKNAAMRLRFGQVFLWLAQRLGPNGLPTKP